MRLFGFEISVRKAMPPGATSVRSGAWGLVREPYAGAWQKGAEIAPMASLLGHSAVYACIARISEDCAKLAIILRQRQDDGTDQPAPEQSPFWGVLRKPNNYQTRQQFIENWLIQKLTIGNTYAVKRRDERGVVRQLRLLDARRVTPMVTPEGDVYYSISKDDLARTLSAIVPASEIIHDRGPTLFHPLVGVPPIYAAALAATQGQRIQSNSEVFFRNMSRPSGMLTAPGTIDETTAERLKKDWETNYSGDNVGRLAVAGDGLTYLPMTIPPEAAQLIDQLKWTSEDIARAFRMPLYKINAGPVPTSNNVQALQQQYHSDCLQGYIEAVEALLDDGLSLPSGLSTEFDLDGLLRMDSLGQMEVLTKGVGGAILKPNEARAKLNRPPVAGGDTVYLQQQNYSLEALAKRDSQEDPFGTAKPPTPAPAAEPGPAAAPAPAPAAAKAEDDAMRRAAEQLDAAVASVLQMIDRAKAVPQAAALEAPQVDGAALSKALGDAISAVEAELDLG